ncbi:hypothetical protein ACIPVB_09110 [Microbacterium sp. NPDC090007]|uniref:hypothetical protein n=1 Tax=Microbacterium sp. NPDC090007 TaxID=3364204 RepID=UPI0037FA5F9E
MNDFAASNGITIKTDDDGDVRLHLGAGFNSLDGYDYLGHADIEALREFFLAEADERLGRWRVPGHPNWVCFATPNAYEVVVFNEDEPQYGTQLLSRGADTWPYYRAAADAYFDAHPEPKPWHDAGPAEVWDVDLPTGGMRAVTVYSARHEEPITVFRDACTQVEIETDDPDIRDARRIFPEVQS